MECVVDSWYSPISLSAIMILIAFFKANHFVYKHTNGDDTLVCNNDHIIYLLMALFTHSRVYSGTHWFSKYLVPIGQQLKVPKSWMVLTTQISLSESLLGGLALLL